METNKLIAEFMDWTKPFNEIHDATLYKVEQGTFELDELQYHTSWDWLMPVVEKIEFESNPEVRFIIMQHDCEIQEINGGHWRDLIEFNETSKLQATYKAVVEFIKWYNK